MRKFSLFIILLSIFSGTVSFAAEKTKQTSKPVKISKPAKKAKGGFGARSLARFNNVDTNKNGSISSSEFINVQTKAFDKKDKDKNGNLSKAEFSPTLAKAIKGTGARSLTRFNKVDTDKNGSVSKKEFLAVQKEAFTRKDKDKNGNLSKAEFSPTLAKMKS